MSTAIKDLGHPITHTLLYGESGSRKTSFAATYPTPSLVLMFDPYDKATPFMKKGTIEHCQEPWYLERQLEMRRVWGKDGSLLHQVEYFADPDPDHPTGYKYFKERIGSLVQEAKTTWATIILDSITFAQYAYLRYSERVLNPTYKDPRLHYGDLKREMVTQLLSRFVWLPTNVVVIAHVSAKGDEVEFADGNLRGANAVGSLVKELPAGYGETYRAFVRKNSKGEKEHLIQTRADSLWYASSQIEAPDPSEMHYEKLWGT